MLRRGLGWGGGGTRAARAENKQEAAPGWFSREPTWNAGKGRAAAPTPAPHTFGAGELCVLSLAPEPHAGHAHIGSASRWEILKLGA